MFKILWVLTILLGMTLIAIAVPAAEKNHCETMGARHWYDKDCCSCDDCRPVKPGEVEAYADEVGEGFRHVETGKVWYWRNSNLRPSKDGGDHICWPPGWVYPNCFYYGIRG